MNNTCVLFVALPAASLLAGASLALAATSAGYSLDRFSNSKNSTAGAAHTYAGASLTYFQGSLA